MERRARPDGNDLVRRIWPVEADPPGCSRYWQQAEPYMRQSWTEQLAPESQQPAQGEFSSHPRIFRPARWWWAEVGLNSSNQTRLSVQSVRRLNALSKTAQPAT